MIIFVDMAFRELITVKLKWALIRSDWWQYKKMRLEGTHTQRENHA